MPEPTITGADFDLVLQHAQALNAVTDLVDAAKDLHGVRPEALASLLATLVEPLEAQLMVLAGRASQAAEAQSPAS